MVRCPLRATFALSSDHRNMRLTGSFPARVEIGRSTFEGTVTVVNDGDRPVEALAASRPDVYVLQAGRIVATPLARDEVGLWLHLAPGAAHELAATGSLPLAPGRYEIYVVLPLVGEQPAVGGPWSLELSGPRPD
jgi:hypothetical protein